MELLIKDLCARLPYGVRVSLTEPKRDDSASEFSYRGGRFLTGILYAVYPQENRVIIDELSEPIAQYNVRCGGFDIDECNVRPYLRSMSSMMQGEWEEMTALIYPYGRVNRNSDNKNELLLWLSAEGNEMPIILMNNVFSWLNKNMFDYRGLIPMGLALEAREGMYGL